MAGVPVIVKKRLNKSYRVKELDSKLLKQRLTHVRIIFHSFIVDQRADINCLCCDVAGGALPHPLPSGRCADPDGLYGRSGDALHLHGTHCGKYDEAGCG